MEENSVMDERLTAEPMEIEEASGSVDGGREEAGIAQLLGIEQEAPAETVEQKEDPAVDAPAQEGGQDKISRAFAAERRRIQEQERRRYEEQMASDPARAAGKRLLEDVMRTQKLSLDQAAALVEESFYRAVAERDNVSPDAVRASFRQEQARRQPDREQREDPQAAAARIRGEVAALRQRGRMPEGFNFDESVKDPSFVQLLLEMPVSAAVRVYRAEAKMKAAPLDVAEKLRARQQIPQSERPQQPVTPAVDYNTLTDDRMLELRQKRKEMRLQGINLKV